MLRRFPPRSPFETDPAQKGESDLDDGVAVRFKSPSTGLMIEHVNLVANWRTLSRQIDNPPSTGRTTPVM
jgi:hypothetical protein